MNHENIYDQMLVDKAYAPYRKEAHFIIKVLLVVSVIVICLDPIAGNDHVWLIIALTVMLPFLYLLFALTVLRVAWSSYLEKKNNLYDMGDYEIIWIKQERDALFAEGHGMPRTLPRLYEKGMNVDRYNIGCIDRNGKSIRLRSAMSEEKLELFAALPVDEDTVRTRVVYGKLSRVIIKYEDPRVEFQRLNEML